ncbi:MAG: TadE/TadG family type IV pilus assembly protein [Pseudomonadota bacterium]
MFSLRRGVCDTSGQVAIIFALSIIPIVAVAGFAIDFNAAMSTKTKVQHIADSAVLTGARAMQAGQSDSNIRKTMQTYVDAQTRESISQMVSCRTPTIKFENGSQDIKLDLHCEQKTHLMHMFGTPKVKIGVQAVSTWGVGKLDVAFMFDVSGSMASSNRMTHLKAAAKDAINTLKPENGGPATEDVRIAMVSYNDMLNAGDTFSDVTGFTPSRTYYATDRYEETVRERYETTCRVRKRETYQKCTRWNRGQCTRWTNKKRWIWVDEPCTKTRKVKKQKTRTVSRSLTSTCIWERDGQHAFSDEAPRNGSKPAQPVSKIYDANQPIYNADSANQNAMGYMSAGYAYLTRDRATSKDNSWSVRGTTCRRHEPLPLTKNRTQMINYVNSLSTGGGTAGHQGVAWAWYLVSDKWGQIFPGAQTPLPYTEPDSIKAVILMTDGAFNAQLYSAQGGSDKQARALCDAIKTQGKILIYTVAFQAPSSGKKVLQYCATSPEFAFAPDNGEELSQAYQAIATSISDLRIKR